MSDLKKRLNDLSILIKELQTVIDGIADEDDDKKALLTDKQRKVLCRFASVGSSVKDSDDVELSTSDDGNDCDEWEVRVRTGTFAHVGFFNGIVSKIYDENYNELCHMADKVIIKYANIGVREGQIILAKLDE